MKVESNLKPENKFEIENIIDGKCDIVFFDNVQEIEAIEENEKKYSFDTYRLKANYRDELEKELNDDIEKYKELREGYEPYQKSRQLTSCINAFKNMLPKDFIWTLGDSENSYYL